MPAREGIESLPQGSPDRIAAPPVEAGSADLSMSDPDRPAPDTLDALANDAYVARERFWKTLGTLEPDSLLPSRLFSLSGGPRWPATREAWRMIRRPLSTLMCTDGLSDPLEEDPERQGFRVEVLGEAPGRIASLTDSMSHWLYWLVSAAGQAIAGYDNNNGAGAFHALIERYGHLSTVVKIPGLPEDFVDDQGNAGVLIGMPSEVLPAGFEIAGKPVRLLAVKLLHRRELAYIDESDETMTARRNEIVALFKGQHVSRIDRPSVV